MTQVPSLLYVCWLCQCYFHLLWRKKGGSVLFYKTGLFLVKCPAGPICAISVSLALVLIYPSLSVQGVDVSQGRIINLQPDWRDTNRANNEQHAISHRYLPSLLILLSQPNSNTYRTTHTHSISQRPLQKNDNKQKHTYSTQSNLPFHPPLFLSLLSLPRAITLPRTARYFIWDVCTG